MISQGMEGRPSRARHPTGKKRTQGWNVEGKGEEMLGERRLGGCYLARNRGPDDDGWRWRMEDGGRMDGCEQKQKMPVTPTRAPEDSSLLT